uniref:At1g61320/AtMIF1 LRR domain-containing protein n=1 Tax=Setaria italica TaxID=4555 RepID=K4AKF6_SETIT
MVENASGGHFHLFGPAPTFSSSMASVAVFGLPIGVKRLKLDVRCCAEVITADHLDIWLQATIRSGILDISVELPQHLMLDYNPACSLLSCAASSLQSISLFSCAFHRTLRSGCLKSLKSVCLNLVHTTGEEIRCLFSSAISLEYIDLTNCNETTFLSIPSHLQELMLPGKFLHLKGLKIYFCGSGFESYGYFSLVSFLETCPTLETFFLSVRAYDLARQDTIPQDFNADSLHIRRIPEFHHASLKKVSINQFFSSKSLIELTCQIVENTSSLRYLVLDTTSSFYPRSTSEARHP